jgi:hypothetical protein
MLIGTAKLMMSPTAMYSFYLIGVLPESTNLGDAWLEGNCSTVEALLC